jgi:uncharacterized membrane protein (DUF2068 family)
VADQPGQPGRLPDRPAAPVRPAKRPPDRPAARPCPRDAVATYRDRCPRLLYVDWSLVACGVRGHYSHAPDEPDLRARLQATSPAGEAWRCLRCGTFVLGAPSGSGPRAKAPAVLRGKELRSALILRFFAVERFLRGIVFAVIAYFVWRFKYSRSSFEQAFNRELPVVRSLLRGFGYDINHSKLIGLIQHAYALIEFLEAIGLWLLKRWGEYFAVVATSLFIPYEIYELTARVTTLRLIAFAINVALVVYLVLSKRLFGARGGGKAYAARLRSVSIIDSELAAVAAIEAVERAEAARRAEAAQPPVAAGGGAQDGVQA